MNTKLARSTCGFEAQNVLRPGQRTKPAFSPKTFSKVDSP